MTAQGDQKQAFDYIVVGAGSAGCAFAGRLVNLLPKVRIALIEAGEDYLLNADPKSDFSDPTKSPRLWNGVANRGYRTVPQKALNDRQLSIVRASGVGGCSLVNFVIWRRGFREDWDENMPTGWKGDDIEPEFTWLEEKIEPFRYDSNFLGERAIEAAGYLGYKKASKDSFWSTPGTSNGLWMSLNKEGLRQDMYRALGADSGGITLIQGDAERIKFGSYPEGTVHASGVMVRMKDGSLKEISVKDKGEVIVTCGAIDTPKLLQLSGVGPAKLLNDLGIPIVADNPSVGGGLKDHVMHFISFETPTLPKKLSPNSINASLYDDSQDIEILFCDGGCTPSHLKYALIEPCREKLPSTSRFGKLRDYISLFGNIILTYVLVALMEFIPSFRSKTQTSVTLIINLMKPTSVGSVVIRSKEPSDPPLIDSAFLKEKADMNTLLEGVKLTRKLVKTAPLSDFVGKQVFPDNKNETELEGIKQSATSYHHSTGTCSIGGCLDDQLRFKGIKCLRVADASSLPFHPRVPTNASAMAVGARCASIIAKERAS